MNKNSLITDGLPHVKRQGLANPNTVSSFGPPITGSLKEAAMYYHMIAKLVGWDGARRLSDDIGRHASAGAIAYALHSLIDDRYPNK